MNDFFELFDAALKQHGKFCFDLGYGSVTDWMLEIYEKNSVGDWGDPIISEQDCDRSLVFANAYVKLAEYLSEKYGGY